MIDQVISSPCAAPCVSSNVPTVQRPSIVACWPLRCLPQAPKVPQDCLSTCFQDLINWLLPSTLQPLPALSPRSPPTLPYVHTRHQRLCYKFSASFNMHSATNQQGSSNFQTSFDFKFSLFPPLSPGSTLLTQALCVTGLCIGCAWLAVDPLRRDNFRSKTGMGIGHVL